jgi:hypothetical protein
MAEDAQKEQDRTFRIAGMATRAVANVLAAVPDDEQMTFLDCLAHAAELRLSHIRAAEMTTEVTQLAQSGLLEDPERRHQLARDINAKLREYRLYLVNKHDKTQACTLVFIPDGRGGRFGLENKGDRKRSHNTRDVTKLLPFECLVERDVRIQEMLNAMAENLDDVLESDD